MPPPDPIADMLRLQAGAAHFHRLGPRAVAELLAELAAERGGRLAPILAALARYERLTPAMLRAAGAPVTSPR
jgi:hypothetical protein